MAYDRTTQIITAPVDMGDIANALGVDSLDLGTLADNRTIKGFARYKSVGSKTHGILTDADIQELNFGWTIPAVEAYALRSSSAKWSRNWPIEGYYRQLDFDGYYRGAPDEVFSQCIGESMVFNVMNPFPGYMAFYFFNRSGYLADREKTPFGLTTLPAGRSEYQLTHCVGIEDLAVKGAAVNSYTFYEDEATLGVMFFDPSVGSLSSPIAQAWCDDPLVRTLGTSYDDAELVKMYRKDLIDVELPSGELEAVFCLRFPTGQTSDLIGGVQTTYRYIRVQDVEGYPAVVPVTVSGAEKMLYVVDGMASSESSTAWSNTLSGKYDIVYVKVSVTNNSGITITNTDAFQQRWNALAGLSGRKTIAGATSSVTINAQRTPAIYRWRKKGSSAWNSGSTSYIEIADGETIELLFQVNDIWDKGTLLTPLSSGTAYINLTPRFDEDVFTKKDTGLTGLLTINYA